MAFAAWRLDAGRLASKLRWLNRSFVDMKIAAVIYQPGQAKLLDDLFRDVAAALAARGIVLAGTVQRNEASQANACASMMLQDLVSSRVFDISVPAAFKTEACSLDPAALEDVAGCVAATLGPGIGLVIVNRFGKQEASGCGLRSVIEQAVSDGIPVLTALCATHLDHWRAFAGDDWSRLDLSQDSILSWVAEQVALPVRVLQPV